MIRVAVSPEIVTLAHAKAEEMGLLRNSITKGQGSIAGFVGEFLVAEHLGGRVENTYDYDVIVDGLAYDVKTKRCNCAPQPDWECTVANFNTGQCCDQYYFVRILEDMSTAWLLGSIDKEDFYERATFYREGDIDPKKPGWDFKADCYNLSVSDLTTQAGGPISGVLMSDKQYDNKGRFAIFINDKKRDGKKDADMKGTYTDLDGIEYWVDAWRGKKQDGSVYYSGSIKPKDTAKNVGAQRRSAPAKSEDNSDW